MRDVNVVELRDDLPTYLEQVRNGEQLRITSDGKVIARLVPDRDDREAARARLTILRDHCWLGDVITSVSEEWEVTGDSA